MEARFKVFRGTLKTWDRLCEEAAAFASEVGPERLISVSQSESPQHEGVVTVWYWEGGAPSKRASRP